MVKDINKYKTNNNSIKTVIDTLIDIVDNNNTLIEKTNYYYHNDEVKEFLISIYLFKLLLNSKENIINKEQTYLNKIKDKLNNRSNIGNLNIRKITNIHAKNETELLLYLKEDIYNYKYYYNKDDNKVYFENNDYIDSKWLLHILILYFDNNKELQKEITISYTMPKKNIEKCTNIYELDKYFKQFDYYKIKISSKEGIKENNSLILRNATNNYLKHLKRFKQGLESEESYLIFYNLIKNECHKQGYDLEEEIRVLSELDEHNLRIIKSYMTETFTRFDINKQILTIDNIIWKMNNSITLLDSNNESIDYLIELVELLHNKDNRLTYSKLKDTNHLHDIQILESLIIMKILNTYLHNETINYNLLNLYSINPAYMTPVPNEEVEQIKRQIKDLERELSIRNNELDEYKFERQSISKDTLNEFNYKNSLEECIGNINRVSITINNIKNTIDNLYMDYKKAYQKQQENQKTNNYDRNYSIVKHIISSIMNSSYYLKTKNNNNLLENIIIFEDYTDTDNAFYLETTFKDLLNICKYNEKESLDELGDLPKLKVGET